MLVALLALITLGRARAHAAGSPDFDAARIFPAGTNLKGIALADLDGDGVPDLALADVERGALILLGKGDGAFQPPSSFPVGLSPDSLALGDFDGDRHLDIVVAGNDAV
ncbi:MAG: VCBS repeat-containing protein, partial [Byssovorax sp.]